MDTMGPGIGNGEYTAQPLLSLYQIQYDEPAGQDLLVAFGLCTHEDPGLNRSRRMLEKD